jgi:hypothetical protein
MKRPLATRIRRALVQPGTGRLGVVSAYFQAAGIAGALGVTAIAASIVLPQFPARTTPANAFVALAGAALMTFGFFRTSRLLKKRRKVGALFAALCFAMPLVGYVSGAAPSLGTLIIAGAGLSLVGSVWRHLE